jgi:long-chain acyl-CoA synthetase
LPAESASLAAPTSLGDLVRRAASARPDGLAVVDDDVRLTWSALETNVSALAAALAGYGLQPGERIAIQAPTSVDFLTVYLAALQAGLVVVPVNPAYTVPELSHIIADSGARVLVTSSVVAVAAAAQLRGEHPALERIVVAARSGADELSTVAELLDFGRQQPPVRRDRTGEDLAVLLYTSGTSGRPKAAMLPMRALMSNLDQVGALSPAPLSEADRLFLPLPLFHIFGLNAGLGMALYFGATVVLASRFAAAASLQTMIREGVTVVIGAPLEFAVWANEEAFGAAFGGVRLALSGSAPLPPDLVARYDGIGVALFEGYGLTEAAPVVTLGTLGLDPSGESGWAMPKPGSIGRPLPGVEVRLVDSEDEVVEPGELGVIEVRGANLFVGYWPDGADGPNAEGWFSTGDLAVADDDGDLYIVGRRSDLVLVHGFNVYPAEVEAVLSRLNGIREVAVVGELDDNEGEVVVAYVVPEPGWRLDTDEVIAGASKSLARFKLPKRIVEVEALPRTATGKVQKWRLARGAH